MKQRCDMECYLAYNEITGEVVPVLDPNFRNGERRGFSLPPGVEAILKARGALHDFQRIPVGEGYFGYLIAEKEDDPERYLGPASRSRLRRAAELRSEAERLQAKAKQEEAWIDEGKVSKRWWHR